MNALLLRENNSGKKSTNTEVVKKRKRESSEPASTNVIEFVENADDDSDENICSESSFDGMMENN